MSSGRYLFTSESVSMGHPDKLADQISDGVLDALLAQDPKSRVACETMISTGFVTLAGEITSEAYVDMPTIVRNTVKEIGYTDSGMGFDYNTCAVLASIDQQSDERWPINMSTHIFTVEFRIRGPHFCLGCVGKHIHTEIVVQAGR